MRFLISASVCLLVVGCGGSGGSDPAAPVVAVSSSVAEEKTFDVDLFLDPVVHKLLREYLDAEAKAYDKVQTRAQFDAIGDLIFKL